MSGIIGSRFNNRGSGLVGSLGTDGQVFTSAGAGTGAVFEDAAGGGLEFIERSTTAGAASDAFTSLLPTTAYQIVGSIKPAADDTLLLRVSDDDGSSYETDSYFWGTSATQGSTLENSSNTSDGEIVVVCKDATVEDVDSTGGCAFHMTMLPQLSGTNRRFVWRMGWERGGPTYDWLYGQGGGGWDSSNAVDAIQFLFKNQTMTGTIDLYKWVNA